MNREILIASVLTFSTLFAPAAMASDADGAEGSIASFVAQSGEGFDHDFFDYDILLTAVSAAGLVEPLADPDAALTLFAPNDLAFVRLARDFGYHGTNEEEAFAFIVATLTDLGGGDPIPLLTQILLYHVLPEELDLFDVFFATGQRLPTLLEGATITPKFFTLVDANEGFADPRIFAPANAFTGNGVVHTIGRVLIPIAD